MKDEDEYSNYIANKTTNKKFVYSIHKYTNLHYHQSEVSSKLLNRTNDKIIFHKLISNFDLIDSYRYFHPHTKIFSFSHLDPISRLDRIYITSTLIPNISQTSYQPNALSDHNNFPSIKIKIPQTFSFKSSHWKLNESILSISCNNFSIKYFISNLLPPLNPIQQPLIWWDKQKRKIKHHIITLSKIQKKKTQTQQNILKTKLQVAQT